MSTGRDALAKDVVVDVHVVVDVDGFGRIRLRSGPFEGPAPGKSPVLPKDRYSYSNPKASKAACANSPSLARTATAATPS